MNILRENFIVNLLLSFVIGIVTVIVTGILSSMLEILVGLVTGNTHDFYPEPFWGAFWGIQIFAWTYDFFQEHTEQFGSTKSTG